MSECEQFTQVTQDKWANVSNSLSPLRTNEQMWAICSGQMSDCEEIAQVAQDKWATVSKMLRSLLTNEQIAQVAQD